MKFRVERDVFAEAVAWAARSLPTRPPLPVLAGLLIEADEGGLTLSSFDYEVSARVEVPAEVAEPGAILVSGRLLADITRSLPDRPGRGGDRGGRAQGPARPAAPRASACRRCRARTTRRCRPCRTPRAPCPATSSRPPSPRWPSPSDGTTPCRSSPASGSSSRVTGSSWPPPTATASRCASWRGQPGRTDLSTVALVQGRSLADTARALADADTVTIALSGGGAGEGLIGFEGAADGESRRTTNRLLDGEFPKYRALLPSESTSVAVIESAAFLETVKRVALVADRNTPVRLTFDDGQVIVEAGAGDEAQAVETLDVRLRRRATTIAFNPQFLQEGIAALGTAYTEISFTTSTKPAVIAGRDRRRRGERRQLPVPDHAGAPVRLSRRAVFVTALELVDFRSYAHVQLDLEPGVTVLVGRNGQGKTNIVEAIGYLATLGSHRVAGDAAAGAARRASAPWCVLRSCGTGDDCCSRSRSCRARATGRGSTSRRCHVPASCSGVLRTVVFAPEDLGLVRGDPDATAGVPRRAAWCCERHGLPECSADYDRVLKQRNALLKSAARTRGAFDTSTLAVWNEHLVQLGQRAARVTAARSSSSSASRSRRRTPTSLRPAGTRGWTTGRPGCDALTAAATVSDREADRPGAACRPSSGWSGTSCSAG